MRHCVEYLEKLKKFWLFRLNGGGVHIQISQMEQDGGLRPLLVSKSIRHPPHPLNTAVRCLKRPIRCPKPYRVQYPQK
jgi:hypothetical protein